MSPRPIPAGPVWPFVVVAFGTSWIVWASSLSTGELGPIAQPVGAAGPAFAAIALTVRRGG